jgi:hypothetical protein
MSDEFGTVNLRRGERSREIEVLRQHYRRHRETLAQLITDAPTEHLASEYRRLMQEIDVALVKLDEIEGRGSGPMPTAPPPPPPRSATQPGMRPLVTPAVPQEEPESMAYDDDPDAAPDSRSRLLLIAVAAIVALAAIGWLIWRSSGDRRAEPGGDVVEQTTDTAPATIAEEERPVTPAAPAPAVLALTPDSLDYGILRKGTRAVRQFEVTNSSDQPLSIQVARSACRCLFYAHAPVVPPKAKETVTVTVDGGRAKAGELRETIKVSAKSDPTIAATFDVNATVR